MPNIITPELVLDNTRPPIAAIAFKVWFTAPPPTGDEALDGVLESAKSPWGYACFKVAKLRGWVTQRPPKSAKGTGDYIQALADLLNAEIDAMALLWTDLSGAGYPVPESPWHWLAEVWADRARAGAAYGLQSLTQNDNRFREEVQAMKERNVDFFSADDAHDRFYREMIEHSNRYKPFDEAWGRIWRAWGKVRRKGEKSTGTFTPKMSADGRITRNLSGRQKRTLGTVKNPQKTMRPETFTGREFQEFLDKSFKPPKSG